jgi:NADPH:quinone reductase-like Zn-dependent oxidoreductase
MKSYRILPGSGVDSLAVVNEEERPLLPDEVRIAVRAVSLNYRDLMVAEGRYLAKGWAA